MSQKLKEFNLLRRLAEACSEVERDIRHNERVLQMHLDVADRERQSIIALLKRDDTSDEIKINTLKNYFDI